MAENSGGPHTLKYGVTTNHVLGVELVLPDGEVVELGGAMEDVPGYDLRGLVVGAEGTFGIVTQRDAAPGTASRKRGARCSASSKRSTTPATRSPASSRRASCRRRWR